MNKIDLVYGVIIGLVASVLGTFIFITFFTDFDFITGIQAMKSQGHLGKIVTLGSILDLIIFAILLKTHKEMMARGVILAVIILTIITLFI